MLGWKQGYAKEAVSMGSKVRSAKKVYHGNHMQEYMSGKKRQTGIICEGD